MQEGECARRKGGCGRDEAQGNNARAGNPLEDPRAVGCGRRDTAIEGPRGDAVSVSGGWPFLYACACEATAHGSREFSAWRVRRDEAARRGGRVTDEACASTSQAR